MKLTIFTPTYNRAHLLHQLFYSLEKQAIKDFEWLIVDDGSEDNTAKIVEEFQQKADFTIRYIFQKNQGKHIAINTGVSHTTTPYFLCVDSDDEVVQGANEKINSAYAEWEDEEKIAAVAFPRFSPKEQKMKTNKKILFDKDVLNTFELNKKYNLFGEFDYVFKTEVLKKYSFPYFEGEKFIKESLVLNRISLNYKYLYINTAIVQGEYLEDGLSSDFRHLLEKSPKGAALAYLEIINNNNKLSFNERKDAFRNYWYFENLAKNHSFWERIMRVKKKNVIFYFILQKLK
ncbi:glycosyltransferase family 2 protein [Chryseobacterium sp. M5]|uniref:glycosyltransferase family 2 protein n=1 Tax=Chryseobacterium TaxID=59732 RepID=UPI003857E927